VGRQGGFGWGIHVEEDGWKPRALAGAVCHPHAASSLLVYLPSNGEGSLSMAPSSGAVYHPHAAPRQPRLPPTNNGGDPCPRRHHQGWCITHTPPLDTSFTPHQQRGGFVSTALTLGVACSFHAASRFLGAVCLFHAASVYLIYCFLQAAVCSFHAASFFPLKL
jgi:hypothetical protein